MEGGEGMGELRSNEKLRLVHRYSCHVPCFFGVEGGVRVERLSWSSQQEKDPISLFFWVFVFPFAALP